MPSITAGEERKGTKKVVQTISICAGGNAVNPASSFELKFGDEVTDDILALPIVEAHALVQPKQIITTSAVDTAGVDRDDSASHLTSFVLSYDGHTTSKILANSRSCDETSNDEAPTALRMIGTPVGDKCCS
jgi:hypothetical protein